MRTSPPLGPPFVPWTSPLVPLAETSSGSTCPVLPLLAGAVSWGEVQHGANLLGSPVTVATEILESKKIHRDA